MSLKRKLTQDDLRKAMSEHKKKLGMVKKIDSPLAKYTDSGQLMCILCKLVVRSETVWPVHLNSKVHKENVDLAKKTKLESPVKAPNIQTFKRPPSPSQDTSASKKIKGILKNSTQPVMQTKSSLPVDFFDDKTKQVNGALALTQKSENKARDVIVNTTDVQNTEKENKEKEKEIEKVKDTNPAALPEGFFDDPIMDAKIRNVEYKDPVEEEWEKFQKEIKEETAQSAQIIADDQEEATTERQMDEIEEQLRHWSRVMDLAKRMEQVQGTDRKQENIDDDASSGDEAEFDEFLDWRAKDSYK